MNLFDQGCNGTSVCTSNEVALCNTPIIGYCNIYLELPVNM